MDPRPQIVLFVGAGASQPFDLPTTAEFAYLIRQNLGQSSLLRRITDAPDVYDAEQILWILESLLSIKRSRGLQMVVENLLKEFLDNTAPRNRQSEITEPRERASVRDVVVVGRGSEDALKSFLSEVEGLREEIENLLFLAYSLKPERATKARSVYEVITEQLFHCSQSHELPIFTTNYDSAIETATERTGLYELIDGFVRTNGHRYFDSTVWRKVPDRPTIKLFKLHGSLTYRLCVDGRIESVATEDRHMTDARHKKNLLIHMGIDEYPYDEPFKSAHEFLEHYLMSADKCAVIGFTFRDRAINDIFDSSMTSNKALKLILVDPSAKSIVDKRFQNLQHRVEMVEGRITDNFPNDFPMEKLASALGPPREESKNTSN